MAVGKYIIPRLSGDCSDSVSRLLTTVIEPRLVPAAKIDPNEFRHARLYTQVCWGLPVWLTGCLCG